MIRSKKIYLLLIVSVYAAFITSSGAEQICVDCGIKTLAGNSLTDSIDPSAMVDEEKPKQQKAPFSDYMDRYCITYKFTTRNQLNQMIRDLESTPYNIDDYFKKAECNPEKSGGTQSPLLHLTAEAPCSKAEFPQIIHKYYTVKRKDPKLWLEVVNAKNTKGETFLDYIEFLDKKENFNTPETKECAHKLISFAYQKGGIYSKVTDKTCP